jgi:hypothetical protein
MVHLTEILFDCIVIGSGPSGSMCAQTITEAGCKTLLLDAGFTNDQSSSVHSTSDFYSIRTKGTGQEEIFLGSNFEGIDLGPTKAGSQLTPARKHLTRYVNELLPLESGTYFPLESLAYEGLGAAWGLGCYRFSDTELQKAGLQVNDINKAYQVIADRIGISYTPDDIEPYTMPATKNLQPAINIDDNSRFILERYRKRQSEIRKKNFHLGIPALALLTADKDDRKATTYSDMDFYNNQGSSAWRPSVTIEELKKKSNFVYQPGVLITSFEEADNVVHVSGLIIGTNEPVTFKAKKLFLASNVTSSARIVLRSFKKFDYNLPLLCNHYSYATCLIWNRLGKYGSPKRTSTAQLSLFHDRNNDNSDVAMASMYSYSSLMLYRVLKEVPLNFKDALAVMQYLIPAITIAGIHHPDEPGKLKYVQLRPRPDRLTNDVLHAHYEQELSEKSAIEKREKLFYKVFRMLGCMPLKKIQPGFGASAHYAGTLPFNIKEQPFTLQPNGRLSLTKNVFVADGSGFNYLPAKGITFTLMANAHNTALNALQHG